MDAADWSSWRPVEPAVHLTPAVLAETLDGGQAFRWHGDDAGIWTGVWSDCVAQLRLRHDRLECRAPSPLARRVASALPRYLGLDTDWAALADALPHRSDPHLAGCLAAFPSLRLLRQPFGETLLGFLCSATKQIVQIKQMLALLAERHGTPICGAESPNPALAQAEHIAMQVRRLPTWPELAAIPEKELRACQLGFRARHVADTAAFVAARADWLEETEQVPYAEAKRRLLELPGVGEKIADCVLLFGAGKLESFPVDTWILKTLARRYGLADWKPAHLAQFGRIHFGPLAGLAQQYLFAWERRHGGR